MLAAQEQQIIQPDQPCAHHSKQKFRNMRINAEIAHSPLVNREAFRRLVRRRVPEKLINLLKSTRAILDGELIDIDYHLKRGKIAKS